MQPSKGENSYRMAPVDTDRDNAIWFWKSFKTGALNHSAIRPSPVLLGFPNDATCGQAANGRLQTVCASSGGSALLTGLRRPITNR